MFRFSLLILSGIVAGACAAKSQLGAGAGRAPAGIVDPTQPETDAEVQAKVNGMLNDKVKDVQLVATAPLGPLRVRKWRLPNGLDVITLPDPTATSVSYVTYFRVGSRDEEGASGGTGLAHLFEHLMFTQTRGAKALDEFDRLMEEAGATANAMTSYDFTAYVDDVPPAALERTVRLEADRMMNLDLRREQVDRERDVVIEERLALVDDSVDGLLEELMYKQAFHQHPYRWPVIGWMDDIKGMTRERALAFYGHHYAPDNAVVVVAGRIDEAETLALIAREYRPLGRRPATPTEAPARPEIVRERAPDAEVRASVERPVAADRMVIGYPAPALADPDRAAYEVLSELLLGGPSARLHRMLVIDKEIASSVRGDVAPTRDPALWAIWVQMTRGHAAPEAERLIVREIERLTAEPPRDAELGAAQSRLETAFWQELRSSHGKAETLGHFDAVTGDFRGLFARGASYRAVTALMVQEAARAYLAAGARSVVVARPPAAKGGPR